MLRESLMRVYSSLVPVIMLMIAAPAARLRKNVPFMIPKSVYSSNYKYRQIERETEGAVVTFRLAKNKSLVRDRRLRSL